MSKESYPLLNKAYAAFIVAVGVLAAGFFIYLGIYNAQDLNASIMVYFFALLFLSSSIYVVYRASKLRITDSGISSGKTEISWCDVSEVYMEKYGVHIKAANKKIVVSPWAYQNPDGLMRRIEDAVRKAAP